MTAFIPLPESYLSWYKSQAWAYISVVQVERREPAWRCYAKVPEGWVFNFSEHAPGWRAPTGLRLEMKRKALLYLEEHMTARSPQSDILKYERLAREFVALERAIEALENRKDEPEEEDAQDGTMRDGMRGFTGGMP